MDHLKALALSAILAVRGGQVEQRRNRMERLHETGVPLHDGQMLRAAKAFDRAIAAWRRAEVEYLSARENRSLQAVKISAPQGSVTRGRRNKIKSRHFQGHVPWK